MTTYFISDLHLHVQSKHNADLLFNFLENKAVHADALYILGDLFAIWLGDDLNLHLPYVTRLIEALSTLAANHVSVYLMHGNRDFLIGEQFCQAAKCTLLPDPIVHTICNRKILLTHGDLLCTQDSQYQKFRKFVQNPFIKTCFLLLPGSIRMRIGNWIKDKANRSNNYKNNNPKIFDVSNTTVKKILEQYQVQYLIHGHTHNAAIHNYANSTRIVLGDWNEQSAKILALQDGHFELQDLRQELNTIQ